jgi:hypothetical protein
MRSRFPCATETGTSRRDTACRVSKWMREIALQPRIMGVETTRLAIACAEVKGDWSTKALGG